MAIILAVPDDAAAWLVSVFGQEIFVLFRGIPWDKLLFICLSFLSPAYLLNLYTHLVPATSDTTRDSFDPLSKDIPMAELLGGCRTFYLRDKSNPRDFESILTGLMRAWSACPLVEACPLDVTHSMEAEFICKRTRAVIQVCDKELGDAGVPSLGPLGTPY